LLSKNVHATTIVGGFRKAAAKALEILDEVAVEVDLSDHATLKKVALTSMQGKVIDLASDHFADIAIAAVMQVRDTMDGQDRADKDDIQIVKKTGKSLLDTQLIQGVILDKEIVQADMPKRIDNASIALLDVALEIEKTEMDAEIRIRDPQNMKAFLDEETRMLEALVTKILDTGANVVLCQKGIDDLAQYYLTKNGAAAVRRIKASDMEKLAKATGGRIVSNVDDLTSEDLGSAALMEERKIGEDKLVFIEGCQNPKAVAILLRAGLERVVDEAERALIDALSVIVDIVKTNQIVAGGGSIEAELAKRIRDYGVTAGGR
jgi:chaperonin GroEL (HSP60 family)